MDKLEIPLQLVSVEGKEYTKVPVEQYEPPQEEEREGEKDGMLSVSLHDLDDKHEDEHDDKHDDKQKLLINEETEEDKGMFSALIYTHHLSFTTPLSFSIIYLSLSHAHCS
jgi:hypothetical protein